MHVSDHSGFHYRQFLLKSLISQTAMDTSALQQNSLKDEPKDEEAAASTEEPRVDLTQLLEEEVEFCTDLIDSYPGHETLWCHR